jgi:site-specific recombinase XerD
MVDAAGAPEEIRTPDPQIRSLDPFVDPTSFSCKPGSNSALTLQGVRSPSANRFDPIEAAPTTPIAAELHAYFAADGSVAEGVRLVELLDNPQNERIKRAYFTYLAEAKGFSETTLDGVAKALNRFETYTKFRDFKAFHIEQAKGFKASLAEQTSLRTKDHLSKATLYATLSDLKRFFVWLAGQPGYKSRISYSDAEYFNLSAKETRIAKAHRDARVPTLEQIRHVIQTMPASTEIERRDRALIALTILTGARDGAIASLKLKHIDIDQGRVDQDAREVKTKFSKSFATWFFPVGEDIRRIVVDWVTYLRQEKLWSLDGNEDRGWGQSAFRGIGPRPQALEQRQPNPKDFQGCLRGGPSALLQPA